MSVTINDIAKTAGVSASTVSRVIAESGLISEGTSQKVREVMRQMDYHPNMIARSLVCKKTNIIGALLPGTTDKAFQHPFFPEILRGIANRAGERGYHILLLNIVSKSEEAHEISRLVSSGMAEGMILMESRINDDSVKKMLVSDFPFVMVGRPDKPHENKIPWVDNDNVKAGYELTNYFLQKGHRRIAFIGISPEFIVTMDRLAGYRKALEEYDIPWDDNLIVNGAFMDDNGFSMAMELLSRKCAFDGLIASDDYQAYAAIHCLAEHGLKVPADIAVAGFNNVTLSEYNMPSLTSVEVHAYDLGRRAFELLLDKKDSGEVKCGAFVPTEIIERASC